MRILIESDSEEIKFETLCEGFYHHLSKIFPHYYIVGSHSADKKLFTITFKPRKSITINGSEN